MTIRPSRRHGDLERPVHLSEDELSAYINGEVTGQPLQRFEMHLDGCVECRERLNGTRTVVSLLHQAATPALPRSFKLDPGMVLPVAVPSESWVARAQPVMRRLTAIAAALLLVLVMADALANHSSGGAVKSTARDVTTSSQGASGAMAQSASTSSAANVAGAAVARATSAAALTAPSTSTPAQAPAQSFAGASSTAEQNSAGTTTVAPENAPAEPQRSGPSYWRLSEFAVGVVVIWLLFMSVALPRLGQRRLP